MSSTSALDAFLDKWRSRWPEWAVAEVFVPAPQRAHTVAWFALLQEFDDILNIAGDPLPADAKLAWWGEELHSWAAQRSRHPLGRVLEPVAAPWTPLAEALPGLLATRAAAADPAHAYERLEAFALAAAQVEGAVFEGRRGAAAALATQVLAQRLAAAGIAAVPLSLRGGGDAAQAQRRWAQALLQGWPRRVDGPRPRRIVAALARARIAQHARAARKPPAAMATLWRAWWAGLG
ncbi:phytoene/squalene synthase family protein [Xanthomonas hyacinthi]|uniref:Phytoene/squalene synthase family protein n=1 Tax=Xanthomonas hyacinthi TaxID=56455 RepID=A0A2S7F1F2_9XANT|nr:squalene/phytoene synthase family protein [Xanthomonas hyacinthi]PPU99267.1 phytoene/squalene synthase family protein [Xanthomonas hyacinthi]QGY78254.1 phytoene/squalene synthase family protein [Xanthomonas hyacinthi]